MKRLNLNHVTRLILFLLPCLCPLLSEADEFSPPAYVPDSQKVGARLSGKNRSYDEWFVQRKDVHTKDPYIWVYNESFAKDFGMPERWVDKVLTGADALAFRTGTSFPLCGWNGRPEACSVSNQCIVEAYFNRKTNPLPWDDRSRWADLQLNQTSAWTLSSLRPVNRTESKEFGARSPFSDPDNGNELIWWFVHVSESASGGAAILRSYDRSLFEGYSFVALDIGCIQDEYAGLELRAFAAVDPSKKVFRSISIPKGWRDRVKPAVNAIQKSESLFFRQKLKELYESEK